jgi:molybdopterin-guanine dinucleotide biosynthesis protein A
MGRDKALLPCGGGVLAQAVARAVEWAAGSATLVGNPLLYSHLGYPVIPDAYAEEGPLGGILTALRHTSADWNLVAACDMPRLTAEFLRSLLERAEGSGVDVVVPAGPSGRPEPLCAVYHRRARPALEAAFRGGIRRAAAALQAGPSVLVEIPEASIFQNVNTPEEWSAHER